MNGVNPDLDSAMPYSKAYHYIGLVTLQEITKSVAGLVLPVRGYLFVTAANSLVRAEVFAFVRCVWNCDRFELNSIERARPRRLYFSIGLKIILYISLDC